MSGTIDETHDPTRSSWVPSARGHPDFPVQNLPYGVFSKPGEPARPGVAIGDCILDLPAVVQAGLLSVDSAETLSGTTLNRLLALHPSKRIALRRRLSELLCNPAYRPPLANALHDASECTLHMPAAVGDYTDFYAGIHHAINVGTMYRQGDPLPPNYKHLPIAYHGRSSSVCCSGTPVRRPSGQTLGPGKTAPSFGPTRELDYEIELGVWIGWSNELGQPIPIAQAHEHIAGLCLLNDWSARDMQTWERLPLGPFLSKSFQTSVSPWIVTTEALAPFRVAPAPRAATDPDLLPYLRGEDDERTGQFSIAPEVALLTRRMRDEGEPAWRISQARSADLYWSFAQMVTHHASNGCNLSGGDLLGTGTIAAPSGQPGGSLLEISRGGTAPLHLPNGETRTYLQDGDEVIFTAAASADGSVPIGFGQCRGVVQPAHEHQ